MRLMFYLWALPASLIGLLLVLPARIAGARCNVVDGVYEAVGGSFIRALLAGRFAAVTLGHVILATDSAALSRCRAHEHAHVRQYQRWGVFFFPLYAAFSLYALLRGRDPYRDNYFERQARADCRPPPS